MSWLNSVSSDASDSIQIAIFNVSISKNLFIVDRNVNY